MFPRYGNTRGMDYMRLHPARPKPARQPEAVPTSFEGQCNPRDLAAGLDRLVAPAMQQGKQPFWVRLQLLAWLALNAGKHTGNQPTRLAHLDDGNDRAILVQGDEGPAQVVRLGHRGTPCWIQRRWCHFLAARPIASLGTVVLGLRYGQTEEMPDGAAGEVAVASPRLGWPVRAPCRYPVDDERVDERFRLFDPVDIAGFRELRELRQDGDAPKDAAGRVALLAQDRHVKLDLRSEPAAHDPVDRLRLEKEALQHGNLHSKVRKLRVRFLLSSCDVPPPSPGAKKITKLLLHRHITEAGTKPRLCAQAHNRGSPS